jgi:hypothetical protein
VFGEKSDVNERNPEVFRRTDVIPVVLIYQEEEI